MTDPIIILVASGFSFAFGILAGVIICNAVKDYADRKAKEREADLEGRICDDLDPHLAAHIRELNEQHSTGRVVPLRRIG